MRTIVYSLFAAGLCGSVASAQGAFTFSVSWRSGSLGVNASNVPQQINEGDLLTFGPGAPGFGPLPAPNKFVIGSQLGLVRYALCLDHQPETPCGIEVDAISQGLDTALTNSAFTGSIGDARDLWFSTDEFATGAPGSGPGPNVSTEVQGQDVPADVWVTYGLGVGPVPPTPVPGTHVGVFDGNGLPSLSGSVYFGLGLLEPGSPTAPAPPWDNLDALDVGATPGFPSTGYYMSVDSGIADPLTNIAGSNTAFAQNVSAADVLFVPFPGSASVVYAAAVSLGLSRSLDDIDALVLSENGVSGYQPSLTPYDWLNGRSDMLLFSVRRGSDIIGTPDSIFGAPIQPGDVLTAPLGGQPGVPPGILFSAESLGLATERTHGAPFGGDDLIAMDVASAPCFDCNNNGVEDQVDISTGGSSDVNGNGIPDECERIDKYCHCSPSDAPCSNSNSSAGCANSESAGAYLDYGSGDFTISSDNLVLTCTDVPLNKFGLFYMGGGQINMPLGDGVRCVDGGGSGTHRYWVQTSGSGGVLTLGPGIVAYSCANFLPSGCISSGDKWNIQAWFRDPPGPCSNGFNFSNGIEVEFGP
jgi:hypothetical protein